MDEKTMITLIILLLLAQNICTIDLDYLSGDSNEEADEKNDYVNIATTPTYTAAGDAVYHGRIRPFTESRKLLAPKKNVSTEQSSTATTAVRPTLTESTRKHPLEVFLDYDYQYQYTKTENNNNKDNAQPESNSNITKMKSNTSDFAPHEALRNNPNQNLKIRLAINANMTNIKNNMTNIKNNTENEDDVYLLEPVGDQLDLKIEFNADLEKTSTWYILERLPCWELPFAFGDLKKAETHSNVFQIDDYQLTNVEIDEDDEHDYDDVVTFRKDEGWHWGHQFNKWCGLLPCYSDHTLCLYPTSGYSRICFHNYQVKGLTMWEYRALISLLNSMRNHVAKGSLNQYPFLPSAANMKQVHYDKDLELMAERWLQQCLPGPSPCLSLDNQYVTQLECTKQLRKCCRDGENQILNCQPDHECYVHPVIGCLYKWYWSAGTSLEKVDVECGHIERWSYTLVQLLWAETIKIGCAYGTLVNGDVRVICNFFPGAPFTLDTKYYCGLTLLKNEFVDFKLHASFIPNLVSVEPIELNTTTYEPYTGETTEKYQRFVRKRWGVRSLKNTYKEKWVREKLDNFVNSTFGLVARLVTRYEFHEQTNARCDANDPVYVVGKPGAMCAETSRKFTSLCYEYRDPTPGYRWVAIVSAMALFLLILYDLLSGVMRQLHND
ncbi:hypothetical protein NE865_13214 [Phthorimaea operculella]|nr:hypothetical protein NE865_13214 [Phthorimaea operculella]